MRTIPTNLLARRLASLKPTGEKYAQWERDTRASHAHNLPAIQLVFPRVSAPLKVTF
jgi:hypothetical protein